MVFSENFFQVIMCVRSRKTERWGFCPELKITDVVLSDGVLSDGVLSGWGFCQGGVLPRLQI